LIFAPNERRAERERIRLEPQGGQLPARRSRSNSATLPRHRTGGIRDGCPGHSETVNSLLTWGDIARLLQGRRLGRHCKSVPLRSGSSPFQDCALSRTPSIGPINSFLPVTAERPLTSLPSSAISAAPKSPRWPQTVSVIVQEYCRVRRCTADTKPRHLRTFGRVAPFWRSRRVASSCWCSCLGEVRQLQGRLVLAKRSQKA
jgi:hypothetical protein